jgi:hypothetical protein
MTLPPRFGSAKSIMAGQSQEITVASTGPFPNRSSGKGG